MHAADLARAGRQTWLKEPVRRGASALFPNVHGGRLSADSVQSLLAKHMRVASRRCPPLAWGVASHAEAQRCYGAAASGRRLLRDRAVARS